MCVCVCVHVLSRSVVSDSLQPFELQPTRFLSPWDCSGKNIRVSCYFLLQGIFPTQGLNPRLLCLLHCRQIVYLLSHQLYIYTLFVYVCILAIFLQYLLLNEWRMSTIENSCGSVRYFCLFLLFNYFFFW